MVNGSKLATDSAIPVARWCSRYNRTLLASSYASSEVATHVAWDLEVDWPRDVNVDVEAVVLDAATRIFAPLSIDSLIVFSINQITSRLPRKGLTVMTSIDLGISLRSTSFSYL